MPGFSLGNLLGLPATPPEEIPKDALPTVGEAVFPDPSQPATARPELDPAHLAHVLDLAALYFAANLPDPRAEGAQETNPLVAQACTVTSTQLFTIPGNHKRISLSLYNSGPDTVYVVPANSVDTTQGMPIPANSEREIKAAAPVRLLSAGTSAIRSLEESS